VATTDDDQLERLADALAAADRDHRADLDRLTDMDRDQVNYLAHVGELADPVTDGIAPDRCP
jgi:hypothetical protein